MSREPSSPPDRPLTAPHAETHGRPEPTDQQRETTGRRASRGPAGGRARDPPTAPSVPSTGRAAGSAGAGGFLSLVRELSARRDGDAVEQHLCERLAARYRFAWVGDPALDGDGPAVRTAAGEEGWLDAAGVDPAAAPWRAACETAELAVARCGASGVDTRCWVACIPLAHDGTVHGVVAAYATAPFDGRDREGLATVGRTAGLAIAASRRRDLLLGDPAVELTFRAGADATPLAGAAADHGCSVSLSGYVSTGGTWLVYCDVEGAAAPSVATTVGAADAVEQCRAVRNDDDGGRIELVVGPDALLRRVAAAGATVRSARADPDGCRLTVEVPRSVDVRSAVAALEQADPELDLRAQRERDAPAGRPTPPSGLLADVTDRQREVLEVAYRAGYFEWPRESTAEEVADAIGLATPTVHAHLRKAEAAIVSALLTGDECSGERRERVTEAAGDERRD